ncbi:hypothetical protein YC2023_124562 [Brassica napus]
MVVFSMARQRESRRRIGGTIVDERLKVWKEYNDNKEQASSPTKSERKSCDEDPRTRDGGKIEKINGSGQC